MLFIALILGIVEGLTEFIPVSSTGHLILFGDLLGFQGPAGKTFEIVIQLGAIMAVCWLYRKKIFTTTLGVLRQNPSDTRFAGGVIIAVIPALFFGALFHDFIRSALFSVTTVSLALIFGGIVILLAERMKPATRFETLESLSPMLCLKIGLCQCLALIPGISRSGATIIGAYLMGVERRVATEFSFFLAIPTLLAASVFGLFENWESMHSADFQLIAAGFTAAFLSALLVVKLVVDYISKHGFAPFAYYRIVLGLIMLAFAL